MKTLVTVVGLVLIGFGLWYWLAPHKSAPASVEGVYVPDNSFVSPAGLGLRYATSTYSLAKAPGQISVTSYIPPCESNFEYCIYRTRADYQGTNFESAGLRVKERVDLSEKTACLTTPPEGFDDLHAKTREGAGYATVVFAPIGDAAAGHYSSGALYRVTFGTTCYEFETRIGESQLANYPEGSITLFTSDDRAAVYAELVEMLNTANIASSNTPIIFPSLDDGPLPAGQS